MQNVEFKAELRDPAIARAALRSAGARPVVRLKQRDTYFRVPAGRLKKREAWALDDAGGVIEEEPTEFVRYERHDRPQPKLSRFSIYTPEEFCERFGAEEPPAWVVVEKVRELWMTPHTRVHLDEVSGLGRFVEFESLVTRERPVSDGHAAVGALRRALGPAIGEPISSGYAELMAASAGTR